MNNILTTIPLDYDEEGWWSDLISEVYIYDLYEQYDRAIEGDADALFDLALFCLKEDIDVNETVALALLEKAAKEGHDDAICKIGLIYANGEGVQKNFKKAVTWFTQAASKNHPDAQNELGKSYEAGKGVLKDFKSAIEWYTKAAEQDHDGAQYNLGLMFSKGRGTSKDFTEAAKWYRKSAEQGNIDAQYILFMQAKKLNVGTEESIDWLHKSAGKDILSKTQYNFKDNDELIDHYLESVCKGYAKAQYQLGTMYFKNGVAEDMPKAKYWIEKAYENSDKAISKKAEDFWNENELWVFNDYSFKNITEPSYLQKIKHTIKTSDNFTIGFRLSNGIGILRDLKKAIKHYLIAASTKGNAEVQYELGTIYFSEDSVKDYSKSKYWINKAYEGINPKISKKAKVFWNKHKLWNY